MAREPLFADTDEETEQILIELARATPIGKKFRQVAEATKMTRAFARAGLRLRYPEASEEELRRRFAVLVLDPETVKKVYGWETE